MSSKMAYIIVVMAPNQENGYVKSVTDYGKLTVTKDRNKAKKYRSEEYAMYDIDLLAEYVMQGYNFYYEVK